MNFPWTGTTGARGVTRYEYDASGNIVKKADAALSSIGQYLAYQYDAVGRLLSVSRMGGTPILLYTLGYDADEAVESGCPALAYGNGRLTLRDDSFGRTWYIYDQSGNVIQEVRRRAGLTGCGGGTTAQDKNPSTTYGYDVDGHLTSIVYPHGRTINYVYPTSGAMDRPASITATTWSGTAWNAPTTVVDQIAWEPYGSLRAYRNESAQWIEYVKGGSLEVAPTATACSSLTGPWGTTDGSARLRGVFVSDGAINLGNPSGNIFKQVYTWNSDQLVAQHTCHRSAGAPAVDSFGYDFTTRVTSESATYGGGSSTYTYDLDNNRTGAVRGTGATICTEATDWYASWRLDQLFSTKWGPTYGTTCNTAAPASGKYNNSYDVDGRLQTMWDENTVYSVSMSNPQSVLGAGLESVFQSASLTGGGAVSGTYSYFYDAFGRRRAKTTPWSSTDEYFYDLGHQMLSDRGSNVVGGTATEFPEDDYIWLGGRPVTIIRGKFTSGWVRVADGPTLAGSSNWCTRDGEQRYCTTLSVVTDYIGKPVVVLDRGLTAGTSTYEELGYSNRKEWRYGSPHSVASSTLVTTVSPSIPPGFDGTLRVLMSRSNFGASSKVLVNGVDQTSLRGNLAHAWGSWQSSSTGSWPISWVGVASDYGFDMQAYELRMKQSTATWAWVPLRFPGQYYDAETDFHENWNRYYDPFTGRYLSPEPMLQKPLWVRLMAQQGLPTPTYAYAANNPLAFTDSTGLDIQPDKGSCSPDAIKVINKLRAKLRSGNIKNKACKKLFDDVGLTDLAGSETIYTIFCHRAAKKANPQDDNLCPNASEGVGVCGGADPENYCAKVEEKKPNCPELPASVAHEAAHLCGPWPTGLGHGEADFDAIEKCGVEVANEK